VGYLSFSGFDESLGGFVPLYFGGWVASASSRPSICEMLKTENTRNILPCFSSSVTLSLMRSGFVKTMKVLFSPLRMLAYTLSDTSDEVIEKSRRALKFVNYVADELFAA
jgi:hypothetical protein